jgi:hypothetical protein
MRGAGAPSRVVQWAQEHGEVGGVLTSHTQLTDQLRAEGTEVVYVDTGSARRALGALPRLWQRPALHLLHLTRLWRAIVLSPVFAALRGRTVLVLHSGSVAGQLVSMGPVRTALLRVALAAYDEVWAVNEGIGRLLPPGSRVLRVVAPIAVEPPAGGGTRRTGHLISLATNAGLPHYNAELGVEAVRRVRAAWPDATLRILAYGHDGEAMARLRSAVSELDWVQLSFDAGPAEVREVLEQSAVLLRPTSWDGDSVVVREALALGARVVASDVAARPAGVELAALDAEEFAQAVVHGGRPSTGEGLATTGLLEAARAALGAMALHR